MNTFEYVRPETIDEAIGHLDGGSSSQVLAGGTDLLTLMKHGLSEPERLVDIKRLPELNDAIVDAPDGVTIGALSTLADIEDHPVIASRYPALSEAAAAAATPQLRNMATIGGNLLQRPRCWYYRSEQVTCWLQGGSECYARDGENAYHALFDESPCVAVHPSDLATALLALNASLTVRGNKGERQVAIRDFFAPPDDGRRTENTLGADDIVVSIHLPQADGARSTYLKAMDRKVWAFALVGVGLQVTMDGDRVGEARLALGGVAPVPHLMTEASAMLAGETISELLAERVAEVALQGATPLARNGYKIPLAKSLIRQAVLGV